MYVSAEDSSWTRSCLADSMCVWSAGGASNDFWMWERRRGPSNYRDKAALEILWVALDWSQCLACHGGRFWARHGVFLPDGSAFCVSGKVCVGVWEALTSWCFWVKDSFTLWKQNCNWPWFHCCSSAADGRPCHSGPVVYRGDIRKSCNALLAPPWLVIS